jgi:uncharacterized coiled-coil protein SlyX
MSTQAPFKWESFFWEPSLPNYDLTDMEEFVSRGLSGFETFFTLLEKCIPLTPWPSAEDCARLFQDTAGIFQRSAENYLGLFGWIPKGDYETLMARCNELKDLAENQKTMAADKDREIKTQTRTISRLNKTIADQKTKLAEQKKEMAAQEKAMAKLEAKIAKPPKA